MSCEKEEEDLAAALERMEAAEEAYSAAFDDYMNALDEVQNAEAEEASACSAHWYSNHWVGDCADAAERTEAARANYEAAVTAREDAYNELMAAQEEVMALSNELCDCYHKNP